MGGPDIEKEPPASTGDAAAPTTAIKRDPDAELHIDGEEDDDQDENTLHIDEDPLELFDTHGVRQSG